MLHIFCDIGIHDLPNMYALSPRALGIQIKQITHAYVTTIASIPHPTDTTKCTPLYNEMYVAWKIVYTHQTNTIL